MPDTAVDTSVLLDVLLDDEEHAAASASALDEAARVGALVIGPATLAELATAFARRGHHDELGPFLRETGLRPTPMHNDDALAAGQAFAAALPRRRVQGSACGAAMACKECGASYRARQRIATDFLIAAHARQAGRLLTRDKRLRMPGVTMVHP